jgi:hypothetical protein
MLTIYAAAKTTTLKENNKQRPSHLRQRNHLIVWAFIIFLLLLFSWHFCIYSFALNVRQHILAGRSTGAFSHL